MSKLEQGRWSQLLRRATGAAGTEVVAGSLSPEISPIWIVQSDDQDIEFLKNVRRCAVGIDLNGAAGFFTRFRLRNPVGSGVIATVTGMDIVDTTATTPFTGARGNETTDLALGSVPTTVIDPRWEAQTTTGSTLILSVDNTLAIGPVGDNLFRVTKLLNETYRMPPVLQVVLTPGSNFDWASVLFAQNLQTSVSWVERAFPELER